MVKLVCSTSTLSVSLCCMCLLSELSSARSAIVHEQKSKFDICFIIGLNNLIKLFLVVQLENLMMADCTEADIQVELFSLKCISTLV